MGELFVDDEGCESTRLKAGRDSVELRSSCALLRLSEIKLNAILLLSGPADGKEDRGSS